MVVKRNAAVKGNRKLAVVHHAAVKLHAAVQIIMDLDY
ncbi:hypothetical protein CBY_0020 [Clostridium butyricum 5521]|nr:hypothetical protein CBY_0020 [Clostridium butyricum 5521]